jgi:hypothetical protein
MYFIQKRLLVFARFAIGILTIAYICHKAHCMLNLHGVGFWVVFLFFIFHDPYKIETDQEKLNIIDKICH